MLPWEVVRVARSLALEQSLAVHSRESSPWVRSWTKSPLLRFLPRSKTYGFYFEFLAPTLCLLLRCPHPHGRPARHLRRLPSPGVKAGGQLCQPDPRTLGLITGQFPQVLPAAPLFSENVEGAAYPVRI